MRKLSIDEETYYWLIDKLDDTANSINHNWCEDIDCDAYGYKEMLKKKHQKYFPISHKKSCIPKSKKQKAAIEKLLSMPQFKKFRYKPCDVCHKKLDTLNDKKVLFVSFTKPWVSKINGKFNVRGSQVKSLRVHRRCKSNVKTPEGFQRI